jgi:hypothetical protein
MNSEELEKLFKETQEAAFRLAFNLPAEAMEAARLQLESGDLQGAKETALRGHRVRSEKNWPVQKTDMAAAALLDHALVISSRYSLQEGEVAESLLIALTRYVGPFKFAALLSELIPRSRE